MATKWRPRRVFRLFSVVAETGDAPWRDGWRHLRYLLMLSPTWVFAVPALIALFVSLAIWTYAAIETSLGESATSPIGNQWIILAGAMIGLSHIAGLLAPATNLYGVREGYRRHGWIALSARATRDEMAASWTMLTIGSAVAWLILLPVHAKHAHDFATPYFRATEAIEHASTDLVIVDRSGFVFAEDFVRNDPFLRNRPKVLDLTFLDEAKLADLCARYSISMFGRPQALAFGIPLNDDATKFDDEVRARLRAAMAQLSCGVDMAVSAH